MLDSQPPFAEVTADLVIGRRLRKKDFTFRCENYVDLAAEFSEILAMRSQPGYRSFPVLDASAPTAEHLREAVLALPPGRTYIHCAQGYGRTALFAVALLYERGVVKDIDEGMALLRRARPGMTLSKVQRRCLDSYWALR